MVNRFAAFCFIKNKKNIFYSNTKLGKQISGNISDGDSSDGEVNEVLKNGKRTKTRKSKHRQRLFGGSLSEAAKEQPENVPFGKSFQI